MKHERLFQDLETGDFWTESALRELWEELYKNGETDLDHFNLYILECAGKNGTLEEIDTVKRYKPFADVSDYFI